jgi:mono/diheme cytochrome c family protein
MNRYLSAGVLVAGAGLVLTVSAAQSQSVGFTQAQATQGKTVYISNCAGCHGAKLQGGAGPALSGSAFAARWEDGGKTVDDLYYIIHTQMPLNAPGSLSEAQYLSVTAYIIQQNGYKPGKTALSSKNLKNIKLVKPR